MAGLGSTSQKRLPSLDEARAISNEANDVMLPEPAGPALTQVGRNIQAYFSEDQPVEPATSRNGPSPMPEALPPKPAPKKETALAKETVPDGKRTTILHGMNNLIKDFNLTPHEAAGLMGNLAHESDWFNRLQEEKSQYTKKGNKGGYGWAQWTDNEWEPRRTNFLKYAKDNKLKPTSDQANYGFLKQDLANNPHYLRAVRGSGDVNAATERFMNSYEKPNAEVAHLDRRQSRAAAILDLYNRSNARTQKLAMK